MPIKMMPNGYDVDIPPVTVTLLDGTQQTVTPLAANEPLPNGPVESWLTEAMLLAIMSEEQRRRSIVIADTKPTQDAQGALVAANQAAAQHAKEDQAACAAAFNAWKALAVTYNFDQAEYAAYVQFRQKMQMMYDALGSQVPVGLPPGN